MRGVVAAGAALLCAGAARAQVAPAPGAGAAPAVTRQADSLTAAAQRAARAWERHDFAALVAGSPGVMVRLGRAEPSAPMPPAQAVLTLRAFAGGAEELQAEVTAVREADALHGYAEVQRTYVARGTSARRVQTLYFGWRFVGSAPRLVEIRVVP
jgi:hypothetical protein